MARLCLWWLAHGRRRGVLLSLLRRWCSGIVRLLLILIRWRLLRLLCLLLLLLLSWCTHCMPHRRRCRSSTPSDRFRREGNLIRRRCILKPSSTLRRIPLQASLSHSRRRVSILGARGRVLDVLRCVRRSWRHRSTGRGGILVLCCLRCLLHVARPLVGREVGVVTHGYGFGLGWSGGHSSVLWTVGRKRRCTQEEKRKWRVKREVPGYTSS